MVARRRRRPDAGAGRSGGCRAPRPPRGRWPRLAPRREGDGPGHDRRRRHLQARRGAGRTADGDERRRRRGRRARLPARPADHGPDRRRRRLLRPARRPRSELVELLAWADGEGLAVGVVGSGSNLLVADEGFHGLVMKLDGELATIERDGDGILCGGGARLPSAAAKAAGWGLTGLEFGVNIPGTVGGAVRMNANAYGGELGRGARVGRRLHRRRAPSAAPRAARLRLPQLEPGRRRGRRPRRLPAAPRRPGRRSGRRWRTMRERRREAQPSGIKTFGSTFMNPEDERADGRSRRAAARGGRLPRPARRRRPLLREARQLRREHAARRRPPTCSR